MPTLTELEPRARQQQPPPLPRSSANSARKRILTAEVRPFASAMQDLWDYREVIFNFARRDLTTRYRETWLGIGWALVQPVFTMIVVSLCLGRVLKPVEMSVPYPLLIYCSLLPWQYFSTALTRCSNSLLVAGGLMKKVYFPRLTCPIASIVGPLVDFMVAFSLTFVLMAFYGVGIKPQIVFLPAFIALVAANTLGFGLWLSALNVRCRDVHHILPFVLQLLLFATPVFYSASSMSPQLRMLTLFNPMYAVISGFRWCLLGVGSVNTLSLTISITTAVVMVVSGIIYFLHVEDQFSDYV